MDLKGMDLETFLFGMNQDELAQLAAPYADQAGGLDKAMHEIGSNLMAHRLGIGPATAIGVAREVLSGVKEGMAGRPVVSPSGFDPNDLRANARGLTAASPALQVGSSLMDLMR